MSLEQQYAQRIAILEAQLKAAASKVAAATPVAKKPSIPAPKPFTGEVSSSAGNTIDEWIDDIERQFRHHKEYFATEQLALEYASNYLSGKASGWWKSTQEAHTKDGSPIVTWEAMKRELRERFQPIEAAQVARMALDRMTQKGSVSSYTEYFYKQMNYIKDMSMADQLHIYIRGLKPGIKSEVMKLKPESIQEVVLAATKTEAWMYMSAPGSRDRSTYGSSSHYRGGASSSSGSAPMELSNINQDDDASSLVSDPHFDVASNANDAPLTAREHQLLALLRDMKAKDAVQQSIHALFKSSASSSSASSAKSNRRPFGGNNRRSGASAAASMVPNVSRDDFTRCWKDKLCLNCKQPGHMARDCKNEFSLKF